MIRPLAISLVAAILGCAGTVSDEHLAASRAAVTSPTCVSLADVGDASPRSDQPTTPNGSGTAVTTMVGTASRKAYFVFDTSAIPSGATVTSAALNVVLTMNSATGGAIREPVGAWAESTITWATQPSAGASIASLPAGTGAQSISLPTSTVQGWIGGTNNGLVVDVTGGQWTAWARETTTTTNRPTVTACYTVAAAPSCSDGVKNGMETDVDCGGNCGPCANGMSCLANTDCASTSECDPWDSRCYALGGQSITPVTSGTLPALDMTLVPTSDITYGACAACRFDRWAQPSVGANAGARCTIAVHEGGGTGGDKTSANTIVKLARMLASSATDVVLAPNYTLAAGTPPAATGTWPAALNDLRGFLAWLGSADSGNPGHTHLETMGCAPGRTTWVGFSQGSIMGASIVLTTAGQDVTTLAGGVTLTPAPNAVNVVNAFVGYYGAYDFAGAPQRAGAGTYPNLLTLCNATSFTDPVWTACAQSLGAVNILRPTSVPWLFLHGTPSGSSPGDIVLWPAQSEGSSAYPPSNGAVLVGFSPTLRSRANASTFVAGVGLLHVFDPTLNVSANWTARAFILAR